MDPSQIAATTVAFLSPYLVKAGEKAAEAVGEKLPDAVSKIWNAITERFKGKTAAEEALADFVAQPDDDDNAASFRKQIKKCMEADPDFANELNQLLERAGQTAGNIINTGSGAVATNGSIAGGEGSVVVGGDVHGGVNITRNKKGS